MYESFIEKIPEGFVVHHKDFTRNNYLENFELMEKSQHNRLHRTGIKCSEETKLRMSDSKKGKYVGEKHPLFGKHHSEESKKLMSDSKKGKYIGEKHPMVKLTEYQVKVIHQISNSPIIKQLKITQKEIGEIFGVSSSHISAIKNNKFWKHITI